MLKLDKNLPIWSNPDSERKIISALFNHDQKYFFLQYMRRNKESLRETFRKVNEGVNKRENPRDHGKDNLEEMSPRNVPSNQSSENPTEEELERIFYRERMEGTKKIRPSKLNTSKVLMNSQWMKQHPKELHRSALDPLHIHQSFQLGVFMRFLIA